MKYPAVTLVLWYFKVLKTFTGGGFLPLCPIKYVIFRKTLARRWRCDMEMSEMRQGVQKTESGPLLRQAAEY